MTAHPRASSLTHKAFSKAAEANQHEIENADLAAEGFDPVLRENDEPDWSNSNKLYSTPVIEEIARITRNDATILVFPVWWWSMPALMKGWIDRVWNNGWAYGERHYPHERVEMLAICGTDRSAYEKRGYDSAMKTILKTGILEYCRVKNPRLHMLYGSIEGGNHPQQIIDEAGQIGSEF